MTEELVEAADPTRDEELAYEASQKKDEDEEGEDGEGDGEEED